MKNLDSILKSRDITLPTKVCLVKAMVFPVVMYGCESWTIKKGERQVIDAFELWCWRRLLRVPWTARRSNQSILKVFSPEYSLEGGVLKLKLTLWTLLASNMLIGCDIEHMDDFTVKLLCNNEVNAINQDMLGKQADLTKKDGDIEIWSRPLADGSIAVGIFNVGDVDHKVDLKALIPSDKPAKVIRDVWRQKNLADEELKCNIPLHGCRYLKVTF